MTRSGAHWSSLRAARSEGLRTVIDSFAIAAGVAAVVLALAVSHGASALVKGPIDGLDRDVVVVAGTAPSFSGVQDGFTSSSLTSDDVVALGNAGYVPDGRAVAPTTGLRDQVQSLDRTEQSDVIGSNQAFAWVRGYTLADGRFLTPTDLQLDAPVVVLGQALVNSLFAGTNPVGRYVEIASQSFQVVGTFQARGYSGAYDQDNLAVIPMTTAWSVLFSNRTTPIDQVLIRAASPSAAAAAAREATTTLLQRHNIMNPAQADFTVQTERGLAASRVATALGVKRALELAAAVLLVAGAIHLAMVEAAYGLVVPDRLRSEGADSMAELIAVLYHGLIGAAVGIVAALVVSPVVHRLAPGLPHAGVTVYGIGAGIFLGVAAATLSLLPVALTPTASPVPSPGPVPDVTIEPAGPAGPVVVVGPPPAAVDPTPVVAPAPSSVVAPPPVIAPPVVAPPPPAPPLPVVEPPSVPVVADEPVVAPPPPAPPLPVVEPPSVPVVADEPVVAPPSAPVDADSPDEVMPSPASPVPVLASPPAVAGTPDAVTADEVTPDPVPTIDDPADDRSMVNVDGLETSGDSGKA